MKVMRVVTLALLCSVLATVVGPARVGATPQQRGYVPEQVGNFGAARDYCNQATTVLGTVALVTGAVNVWLGVFVGAVVGVGSYYGCYQALDKLDAMFTDAYRRSEREGVSPGYPTNDVHLWNGVGIQDFTGGDWGDGALMYMPQRSQPNYIGGGAWDRFKRAANSYHVFPGYPINTEHRWGNVPIQDFRGGAWGDGAIICSWNGDLVAGNHWKGYVNANGSIRLGCPLTFVNANHGWWVQRFQGGQIWERQGRVKVWFYDTNAWQWVL